MIVITPRPSVLSGTVITLAVVFILLLHHPVFFWSFCECLSVGICIYCSFLSKNLDVIEEDALNEECCVQVLRTLNTKADAEIEELEKDLLSLQNELAWAQDENWREICSSALTERINWLDVAVSKLKSGCADDTETQLQLHSKPAETLQEIVKALQRGHCQETDVQV